MIALDLGGIDFCDPGGPAVSAGVEYFAAKLTVGALSRPTATVFDRYRGQADAGGREIDY